MIVMTLLTVHACSSLAFGAPRHLCTHIYSALFENGGVRCHLLREVPYGYDPGVRFPWGERATALATIEGHPPQEVPDTYCPVCFDDFTSALPTPDPQSRAPPGRWACPMDNPCLKHAVCRECDSHLQARPSRAQQRCPICRSARGVVMLD